MNLTIPNLLDHQIPRDDVASLITRLGCVRQEVYDCWTADRRNARTGKAIQRALDDALVLALVLQYLRRRSGSNISITPNSWAQQGSVSQMASLAASMAPQAQQILLDRAFANKCRWPEHARSLLFGDCLPAAFKSFVGNLPITILGDFHQMCLSRPLDSSRPGHERRQKGAHYTPASLVDYMVARSLDAISADGIEPHQRHILDPSCGCGAFLIAILRYLSKEARRLGAPHPSRRLYGSDIDSRAIDLARLSLGMAAWSLNVGCSPNPICWDRNLVERDFLARSTWESRKFDLIIGGPPFIRVEQLHDSDPRKVAAYRARYRAAQSGQFDLYMLFMEKAIGLLRPGGRLIISVSSSFLRSRSGATIRGLLAENCRVEEIIEFESSNIYPDASVQIAVLLIRKGEVGGRTRYGFVPDGRPIRQHLERLLRPSCKSLQGSEVLSVELPEDGRDGWSCRSPRDESFLRRMDAAGSPLGTLPVHVSLGMCTGADDIFILRAHRDANGETYLTTRSGGQIQLEEALLRPILRARHSRNGLPDTPYVCIFPYDSNGASLGEGSFRRRYPLGYQYLHAHRARLTSRRLCPGQPWFALRKVDVACHLARHKVVAPTTLGVRGFRLNTEGVLCHHSLLTIILSGTKVDPRYLVSVLNSSVLWRYISLRAPRMGAGRFAFRLGLASHIPIVLPQTASQRSLVKQIIKQVRQEAQPESTDRLVAELYGLPHSDP